MNQDAYTYINCHTHIHNVRCAPDNFVGIPIANELGTGSFYGKAAVKLVTFLSGKQSARQKLGDFMQVGLQKTQKQILEELKSNSMQPMKHVLLTLNMDHMGAGRAIFNFRSQLNQVAAIKAEYLNSVIPFYSIDPRADKPDAQLKNLKEYISKYGFGGIKLYPSLGFYPFDPALECIYQYAAEWEIPIITHCSKGGIFFQNSDISNLQITPMSLGGQRARRIHLDGTSESMDYSENIRKYKRYLPGFINKYKRNGDFKSNFTNPLNYINILEYKPSNSENTFHFDKLKICLAHFGGDEDILTYVTNEKQGWKNPFDKSTNWHAVCCELMIRYPNVYADVSYSLWNEKFFDRITECIDHPQIGPKVLFGTDYYMTLRETTEKNLVQRFVKHIGNERFAKIAIHNNNRFLHSKRIKQPAVDLPV